jgi:TonB family protein
MLRSTVAPILLLAALTVDARAADEPPPGPVLTRAPELIHEVLPNYPEAAIAAEAEGDVQVELTIEIDGSAGDPKVLEGLGHGCDEAALEAAAQLRFTPAEVDGEVQAIRIVYTFSFRLADVQAAAQPEPTGELMGVVADAISGAILAGVSVSLSESGDGVVTDAQGRFAFERVQAGDQTVVLYLDGYHRLVERIEVRPGERVEVESALRPVIESPNVTVVRGRKPWREIERAPLSTTPSTVTSHVSLTRRDIDFTPGGMEDVIQAVGRQPGVVADPHYGQFWIRGGDSGETVFYLDRVSLYNPFHLAGFNSLFNPELLDTAEVYLGAPPAVFRDSLSGVLDVSYYDGTPGRWDGTIDVSTATAKGVQAFAVGPRKQSTIVLGGRRTYFEPVFAVLRELNLVGDYFLTPRFGEVFARYVARPGPTTRLRMSALYSDDLISFEEGDEDGDPLWEVKGKLRMLNRTFLAWGDLFYETPTGGSLAVTASYLSETSENDRRGAFDVQDDTLFRRIGGRADLRAPLFANNVLSAGMDLAMVELVNEGDVLDGRSIPTWDSLPLADYGLPIIHVDPRLTVPDGAIYVEDDWQGIVGGLDARLGVRWSFANPTGQQLVSPRLGLAYNFPTRTTLKLAAGLYHQPPLDPLVLDATYGNPQIRAERNLHLIAGVDQLLPFGALIRAEVYYKAMDNLVVNPDNRDDVERGITYTNDGTGWASGFDLSYGMRTGRVGGVAQYSLLFTRRTNPLNRIQPTTFAPPQDQRHTALVGINVTVGKRRDWILSASYQFHTGRPHTPVSPVLNSAGDGYTFELGELNSERYGNFHEINVRSEIFRHFRKAKFTFYVEVLNVTNFQSEFLYIWGDATVDEDGNLRTPERRTFTHLPIRPWFGFRLEY